MYTDEQYMELWNKYQAVLKVAQLIVDGHDINNRLKRVLELYVREDKDRLTGNITQGIKPVEFEDVVLHNSKERWT